MQKCVLLKPSPAHAGVVTTTDVYEVAVMVSGFPCMAGMKSIMFARYIHLNSNTVLCRGADNNRCG